MVMGFYVGGMVFGGMVGCVLIGVVVDYFGWCVVMGFIGMLGLFVVLVFLWLLLLLCWFVLCKGVVLGDLFDMFGVYLCELGLCLLFVMGFLLMGGFVMIYNYVSFYLFDVLYVFS